MRGSRRAGRETRKRAGVVDVGVIDTRVSVTVRAGERDSLVGSASLRAANTNLSAGRVELGTAGGHSELERNDLVSDKIVARFNLVRKSQGYGTAVRWHESDAY
jgi:hypothetical protein